MIRVSRIGAPAQLDSATTDGWTNALCNERAKYYRDLTAFQLGKQSTEPKRPKANGAHYGHSTVVESLRDMFGAKCAYCEGEVAATSAQHVEHFRPASRYPALAYSWDNLLFACMRCNSTHKGDKFPLLPSGKSADELKRRPCNRTGLTEKPLLLNPCIDNPADHFAFRDGLVIPKSKQGQWTIDICGLNRDELVTSRKRHLQIIRRSIEEYLISEIDGDIVRQKRHADDLLVLIAPSSPYSAMAKAELDRQGIDWQTL